MYRILCISVLCFSIGCIPTNNNLPSAELSTQAKVVSESMSDVSKDDCEIMFKQFTGLAEYLTHSGKNITTTPQVFELIKKFQTDYGWSREKYTKYTDAVEKYLTDKNYKLPKKLVDSVSDDKVEILRSQVILDIKELGTAAKLALEKSK